ncbi:MAG: LytR C-terminal domain-containing protein [Acidimicrobiia bacterium]
MVEGSGTTLTERPITPPLPRVGDDDPVIVDVDPLYDGPEPAAAPLPRRSRRQLRRRRRRVRVALLVLLVVVLLAATTVAVSRLTDRSGTPPDAPAASEPAAVEETTTHLIGSVDPDGTASLLVLVGENADGGPSLLLVPVGTQVEVPSLGPRPLREVPVEVGEPGGLLPLSVSNALGVRSGDATMVPTLDLSATLAAVPAVDVRLREPVTIDTDDGRVSFPAGNQTISGQDAGRLLLLPGEGSELDDLVTAQAVLEGLLAAMSADTGVADGVLAGAPGLEPLVEAAAGGVHVETLPVEPVGSGDDERFRLRDDDIPATLDSLFPGAVMAPDGSRPRVELRNGAGLVGVTAGVAEALMPLGVEVTLTGNIPGFGIEKTSVAYHRDENREAAQEIAGILGGAPVGKADPELGSVDVTVVIGADIAPTDPGAAPAPAT